MSYYLSSHCIKGRSFENTQERLGIDEVFEDYWESGEQSTKTMSKEDMTSWIAKKAEINKEAAQKLAQMLIDANDGKPLTKEQLLKFLDGDGSKDVESSELRMAAAVAGNNQALGLEAQAHKDIASAQKLFSKDGTLDNNLLKDALGKLIDPASGKLTEAGKKEGAFDVIALALLGVGMSDEQVSKLIDKLKKEDKNSFESVIKATEKNKGKEEVGELNQSK